MKLQMEIPLGGVAQSAGVSRSVNPQPTPGSEGLAPPESGAVATMRFQTPS